MRKPKSKSPPPTPGQIAAQIRNDAIVELDTALAKAGLLKYCLRQKGPRSRLWGRLDRHGESPQA